MKKLLLLLAIPVLLSDFGAIRVSAQEKLQEFIVLKLIIKKEIFEQQLKVPIKKSFEDGKLTGGGFATTGCINCPLTANYDFFGFAEKVNQNTARLSLTAYFKNQESCSVRDKNFIVSRNKITKLRLRCGIKIVAFYENKTPGQSTPDN